MTPEYIISEVALVTGVPAPAITGRNRSKHVCQARFLAVAALWEFYNWWTLKQTADFLNRTEHGTIIHARARHLQLQQSDPAYLALATQIYLNLDAYLSR